MKKIKGKKFIKKFILSMMLVILLSSYMVPSISFAEYGDEDKYYYFTEYQWTFGISYSVEKEAYCSVSNMIKTVRSWEFDTTADEVAKLKNDMSSTIKKVVKDAIKAYYKEVNGDKVAGLTDLEAEQIMYSYKDDKETLQIGDAVLESSHTNVANGGNVSGSMTATQRPFFQKSLAVAYSDKDNFAVKIKRNINFANRSDEPIDETDENNDAYDRYKEEENDGFGVGGMLLKPLFSLVNLVADTLQGFLSKFMLNDFQAIGLLKMKDETTLENEIRDAGKDPSLEVHDEDVVLKLANATEMSFIQYPNILYTPEEIFKGEIPLLSIDFISGNRKNPNYNPNDENSEKYVKNNDSGWQQIRVSISKWYKVFRMIAILGLLCVLIYTGVKIIISSTGKDKAKYKEWIVNWFIAVALLFSMHFIMAFTISVVEELNTTLSAKTSGIVARAMVLDGQGDVVGEKKFYSSNLMGIARFMIQSENAYVLIAYEVIYIALIVYTFKFTVIYLKRVLSMAFLTMIAPIVAFTYPIDKISDGKAQGFDMWIKEYFFNALLQPLHYFMYYVLLSSAIGIAAKNPLYGIVVLGFMTQAEKMLKKIFGFDKASGGTVGGMAGAFAAGAIASQVKNIARMGKGALGGGGKDGTPQHDLRDVPNSKLNMDNFDGAPTALGAAGETPHTNPSSSEVKNDKTGEKNTSKVPQENGDNANIKFGRTVGTKYDLDGNAKALFKYGNENLTKEEIIAREKAKAGATTATRKDRFIRGAKAVGKRFAKPVWDFDVGGDRKANAIYNAKRLGKKGLRAAAGIGMGVTAAAVQAGISITDGKYNPLEGIASFGAGYAGAGKLVNKAESYYDTFSEAGLQIDDAKKMEARKKEFEVNQNVVSSYQNKYGDDYRKYLKRAKESYYGDAGIKDISMQMQGLKYADAIKDRVKAKYGYSDEKAQEEADRIAAKTLQFREMLSSQGESFAIYDNDRRDKYIDSMVQGKGLGAAEEQKLRENYMRAFDLAREMHDINKK